MLRCNLSSKKCEARRGWLRLAVLAGGALLAVETACACGPDFPNALLLDGDKAVLGAPVADFRLELARMGLRTPQFQDVRATNGYPAQTADADIDDLRAALKQAGTPDAEMEEI